MAAHPPYWQSAFSTPDRALARLPARRSLAPSPRPWSPAGGTRRRQDTPAGRPVATSIYPRRLARGLAPGKWQEERGPSARARAMRGSHGGGAISIAATGSLVLVAVTSRALPPPPATAASWCETAGPRIPHSDGPWCMDRRGRGAGSLHAVHGGQGTRSPGLCRPRGARLAARVAPWAELAGSWRAGGAAVGLSTAGAPGAAAAAGAVAG